MNVRQQRREADRELVRVVACSLCGASVGAPCVGKDGGERRANHAVRVRQQARQELHFEGYKEYLETPYWHAKRRAMIQRAGHRCQLCNGGNDDVLHVHHRTYQNLGAESLNDLIVLCVPCHNLFHGARRLAKPI